MLRLKLVSAMGRVNMIAESRLFDGANPDELTCIASARENP